MPPQPNHEAYHNYSAGLPDISDIMGQPLPGITEIYAPPQYHSQHYHGEVDFSKEEESKQIPSPQSQSAQMPFQNEQQDIDHGCQIA